MPVFKQDSYSGISPTITLLDPGPTAIWPSSARRPAGERGDLQDGTGWRLAGFSGMPDAGVFSTGLNCGFVN